MHEFNFHTDPVIKVEFSPFKKNVFSSISEDNKIGFWDISKIGDEIEEEEENSLNEPTELFFTH